MPLLCALLPPPLSSPFLPLFHTLPFRHSSLRPQAPHAGISLDVPESVLTALRAASAGVSTDTDALRELLDQTSSGKAHSDLTTKVKRAKDLPDEHVNFMLQHFHDSTRANFIARPEFAPFQCSPRLLSLVYDGLNGGTYISGLVPVPPSHNVYLKGFSDRPLFDIGKGGPQHLCAQGDATPLPNLVQAVLCYLDAHEVVGISSLISSAAAGGTKPLSGGRQYKSFRTSLVSLLMKLTDPRQARLVGELLQDRACTLLNELSEPVDFDDLLWPKMDQLLSTLEVQRSTGALGTSVSTPGAVTSTSSATPGGPASSSGRHTRPSSSTPTGVGATITKKGGGAQPPRPTTGISGRHYPSIGAARRANGYAPGPLLLFEVLACRPRGQVMGDLSRHL